MKLTGNPFGIGSTSAAFLLSHMTASLLGMVGAALLVRRLRTAV